jgi:hypothetical protein
MLNKQHDCLRLLLCHILEPTVSDIQKARKNSHVVYPSGKPRIPHQLRCEAPPDQNSGGFPVRMLSFSDSSPWPQPKVGACGKPAGQGIGVNDYSITPELVERDALHLRHPRFLQRQGKHGWS